MTQRDRWAKRPAVVRYREFCDAARAVGLTLPEDGFWLVFWLPMPPTWSKAKRARMRGEPHTQRPDIDNLLKAALDAIYQEDAHIWRGGAEKRWADDGAIDVCGLTAWPQRPE